MIKAKEWLGMSEGKRANYIVQLYLRTWKWKRKIMTRKPSTRFPFGGDLDPFTEEE